MRTEDGWSDHSCLIKETAKLEKKADFSQRSCPSQAAFSTVAQQWEAGAEAVDAQRQQGAGWCEAGRARSLQLKMWVQEDSGTALRVGRQSVWSRQDGIQGKILNLEMKGSGRISHIQRSNKQLFQKARELKLGGCSRLKYGKKWVIKVTNEEDCYEGNKDR